MKRALWHFLVVLLLTSSFSPNKILNAAQPTMRYEFIAVRFQENQAWKIRDEHLQIPIPDKLKQGLSLPVKQRIEQAKADLAANRWVCSEIPWPSTHPVSVGEAGEVKTFLLDSLWLSHPPLQSFELIDDPEGFGRLAPEPCSAWSVGGHVLALRRDPDGYRIVIDGVTMERAWEQVQLAHVWDPKIIGKNELTGMLLVPTRSGVCFGGYRDRQWYRVEITLDAPFFGAPESLIDMGDWVIEEYYLRPSYLNYSTLDAGMQSDRELADHVNDVFTSLDSNAKPVSHPWTSHWEANGEKMENGLLWRVIAGGDTSYHWSLEFHNSDQNIGYDLVGGQWTLKHDDELIGQIELSSPNGFGNNIYTFLARKNQLYLSALYPSKGGGFREGCLILRVDDLPDGLDHWLDRQALTFLNDQPFWIEEHDGIQRWYNNQGRSSRGWDSISVRSSNATLIYGQINNVPSGLRFAARRGEHLYYCRLYGKQ